MVDIGLFKRKAGKWLCKLGFHNWSENRFGIRVCLRCPKVDRYFGLTGLLRYREEKKYGGKQSDIMFRELWLWNR